MIALGAKISHFTQPAKWFTLVSSLPSSPESSTSSAEASCHPIPTSGPGMGSAAPYPRYSNHSTTGSKVGIYIHLLHLTQITVAQCGGGMQQRRRCHLVDEGGGADHGGRAARR